MKEFVAINASLGDAWAPEKSAHDPRTQASQREKSIVATKPLWRWEINCRS